VSKASDFLWHNIGLIPYTRFSKLFKTLLNKGIRIKKSLSSLKKRVTFTHNIENCTQFTHKNLTIMKNTKKLALLAFGLVMTFSSCKNNETKIEDAQEDVLEARQDLVEAETDSLADYEAFKMKINEKVTDNELKIADLRVKAVDKGKDGKERIAKRIKNLEEKNNELKAKLAGYSKYDSATWESFKTEVEKSSDNLQKEFDELNAEKND